MLSQRVFEFYQPVNTRWPNRPNNGEFDEKHSRKLLPAGSLKDVNRNSRAARRSGIPAAVRKLKTDKAKSVIIEAKAHRKASQSKVTLRYVRQPIDRMKAAW